jgi:hypothetical protein
MGRKDDIREVEDEFKLPVKKKQVRSRIFDDREAKKGCSQGAPI